MFDYKIPDVKKINKTAVAVVGAVLVGGYVFFGLQNINKKPEFGTTANTEQMEGEVNFDAPQFIRSRDYNDLNTGSETTIDPAAISPMTGNEMPVGEVPPPSFESQTVSNAYIKTPTTESYYAESPKSYGTYDTTYSAPAPIKRSKKELRAEKEALADNSPSGWGSNNQSTSSGIGYNSLSAAAMPTGPKGEQDTRNSHQRFLDGNKQHEDVYLGEKIEHPRSPFQIMAGTVIPCTLISGIDSDLPGEIVAQVRGQVFDSVTGKYLLVPHGTKFIGAYDSGVLFGQQRCLFAWKRLIFPDGRSIQLQGMNGVDLAGYAGIKDSVDFHYMRLTGAVLMSSFLAAGTKSLDNGNTFRSTMAEDMNKSGQKIVDMQLNVQPTIKIAPATRFNIFVNKDIVLTPYRRG